MIMTIRTIKQWTDAKRWAHQYCLLFAGFFLLYCAFPVARADTSFTPSVTVGEIYTDNVNLVPNSGTKQSQLITELKPGFLLSTDSNRLKANVQYYMQDYFYARHGTANRIFHNLNAAGSLEAVNKHLFIDARLTYGQQIVDPIQSSGSSNFFLTNNRSNIGTYGVTPYWLQDLGGLGMATLGVSYGRVYYDANQVPDARSYGDYFNIVSPKDNPHLGWKLNYRRQVIDRNNLPLLPFETASLELSLKTSSGTQLFVTGGRETDFLLNGTSDPLGASFWNYGIAYDAPRDHFKISVGHRFFGRSYSLKWTHDAAHFNTNVSYEENPTDVNQLLLGRTSGSLITSPLPPVTLPALGQNGQFIQKRFAATVTYTGALSTIQLTFSSGLRSYEVLQQTDHVTDIGATWEWAVGVRTSIIPSIIWQRYRFSSNYTTYTGRMQLAYQYNYSDKLYWQFALRREFRNTPTVANDYRSNVVLFEITQLF